VAVDVHGERAAARSYVDAVLMSRRGTTVADAVGIYDDRFVRTDSGWRIDERRFTMVRHETRRADG